MEVNFWAGIGRGFFGLIDSIVYKFITIMYNAFIDIANLTVLNQDMINALMNRIYIILGVAMLFKLTFSLIQYFANPDSISGDKGAGKLVQKIVVMLIILVSVPTIFNMAFKLQGIVLEKNVLGNLILGSDDSLTDEAMKETYKNAGDQIGVSVLKGFFYPYKQEGDYSFGDNSEWFSMTTVNQFGMGMALQEQDGYYTYEYSFLFSTLAGGLTVWIIMLFCFDVAIRSVKLAFLQLIAPIPIIASVDPKGKKTFDNWLSNCIKTYLDVFVRLLAIFFVVFVITQIAKNGGIFNATTGKKEDPHFLIMAMVIIGLLLFAKQVPKLLEDLLGIKMGGFKFSPFKRLGEVPGLGKVSAAAGGIVAGAVAGGRVGDGLRGALLGGVSGWRSVPFGGDKDGKGFSKGANTAYKSLMGKDFFTFGPEKLLRTNGDQKVQVIKDALKNAYGVRDQLSSELNVAENNTATTVGELSKFGITNPKDQKQVEDIKSKLSETDGKLFMTYMERYEKSVVEETKIRNDISKVEKDIKDLSNEKGQRERFYNVDPSPAKDVTKLTEKSYVSKGEDKLTVEQWRENQKK